MRHALALAVWTILAAPLMAQSFETTDMRDWSVVQGTGGQGCFATLSVGLKAPSSGLATLSIFARQGGGDTPAVMSVQVPLGASLPQGIAYTHAGGSEAVGLAWQYCTPETCVASGGISQDELQRLKDGRRVFLGFVPLPGSAPLVVPVSLLGITRAWEAVQDCA